MEAAIIFTLVFCFVFLCLPLRGDAWWGSRAARSTPAARWLLLLPAHTQPAFHHVRDEHIERFVSCWHHGAAWRQEPWGARLFSWKQGAQLLALSEPFPPAEPGTESSLWSIWQGRISVGRAGFLGGRKLGMKNLKPGEGSLDAQQEPPYELLRSKTKNLVGILQTIFCAIWIVIFGKQFL